MANTYLKEMAREREKFLHSPTSRLRQASQLCSCKSSKYKDMRHGKHVPQGDGKREEKRGHFFQNSHFPIFPSSHITKNKCNKKDNILIYNNLDKNTISCWDNGTLGQVGQVVQFCKDFLTAIHSPTSWIRQSPCLYS